MVRYRRGDALYLGDGDLDASPPPPYHVTESAALASGTPSPGPDGS